MKKKSPTPEQQEAAKKRREQFRALVSKVAAISDEERAELAKKTAITTVDGHVVSPTNAVLLIYQRSDVTIIGGFRQWLKSGRVVRKGEKALAIWVPCEKNDSKDSEESVFFVMGNVFDVSQTEELSEKEGV
jgi:hypothetical protein